MPDAAQLHFYMGHVGMRRDNPDYYKLLVMDYVLGTGPGFTDRLSARLRDREGLAYTVQANISGIGRPRSRALFTCYIGTEPKNFERVKKEFLEEFNRIRDEKPTKEEVEDAKQYLLGSLPFNFTTERRRRRPAADHRALQPRLQLPRRLPQGGRRGDAGRRAGGGEEVPRPEAHGPGGGGTEGGGEGEVAA